MKILVTGGTGVIGTAAIPALLQAGHTVRLLSRHAADDARSFSGAIETVTADISAPQALTSAVEGCAAILHIAGIVEEDPPEVTFEKVNVAGTEHLLTAARAAAMPRFIYVSSLGAERGESAYHQSKRRAEELVRAYPGEWLILQPGNVFGPGDETLSLLLKMLRTLPAIPTIGRGDQPFQPIWYADFGHVLAQAVTRADLAGKTLEVAGVDVTTTEDVLQRLTAITGCERPRFPLPVWLTEVGVQALEAFGAAGKKLLRHVGLGAPLSSATLTMLLEESVISKPEQNALLTSFAITPTPLDDALRMLADLLPEQLPGDGVGAMKQSTYSADIHGSRFGARALLDHVCDHLNEVMPIEFAAEPGAPAKAKPGETMTANIVGRGHVQVRLEERTPERATFVTLEGHPLAGLMQLHAEDLSDAVRFSVHLVAQPANIFDWVALRTIGAAMQAANWRSVVRRVVELSGGEAPGGVHRESHTMDSEAAREVRAHVERLVERQQRQQRDATIAGHAPTDRR